MDESPTRRYAWSDDDTRKAGDHDQDPRLPEAAETATGWKMFTLDCEGQQATVTVRPKLWTKLEEATKWPLWVASVTGKMGPRTADGFALLEPAIQAFERKAKPEGASTPAGKAPAGA